MIISFKIDGINYEFFKNIPEEYTEINLITSILPMPIPPEKKMFIYAYLKDLVYRLKDDGYVLYNGVKIDKKDINISFL